jgi:methionine-rich copper-binding protein CopC
MTTDRAPSHRLFWRRVGAAAVALLAASVLILALVVETGPARLMSALPADGARLVVQPARIELTFSARPDPARSHLSIGTVDGTRVPAGAVGTTGDRMSVPVSLTGDGEYLVAYHAVFPGGRAVSGMLRFAIDAGTDAGTDADTVPAADGGPAPGPGGGVAPDGGGHGHGGAGPGVTLAVSTILVALGMLTMVMQRRRRAPDVKVGR